MAGSNDKEAGAEYTELFIKENMILALRKVDAEIKSEPAKDSSEFAFRVTKMMLALAGEPPHAGKVDPLLLASMLEERLFAPVVTPIEGPGMPALGEISLKDARTMVAGEKVKERGVAAPPPAVDPDDSGEAIATRASSLAEWANGEGTSGAPEPTADASRRLSESVEARRERNACLDAAMEAILSSPSIQVGQSASRAEQRAQATKRKPRPKQKTGKPPRSMTAKMRAAGLSPAVGVSRATLIVAGSVVLGILLYFILGVRPGQKLQGRKVWVGFYQEFLPAEEATVQRTIVRVRLARRWKSLTARGLEKRLSKLTRRLARSGFTRVILYSHEGKVVLERSFEPSCEPGPDAPHGWQRALRCRMAGQDRSGAQADKAFRKQVGATRRR